MKKAYHFYAPTKEGGLAPLPLVLAENYRLACKELEASGVLKGFPKGTELIMVRSENPIVMTVAGVGKNAKRAVKPKTVERKRGAREPVSPPSVAPLNAPPPRKVEPDAKRKHRH